MAKDKFSRLPTTIVPRNYNIWLKPCLDSFSFRGKVDVTLQLKSAVEQIVLNCAEIEITSATYCQKDLCIYEASSISHDQLNEKACINFKETLAAGEGVLSILFSGILNDKMKGFYRSRYVDESGVTQFGAATQFEPTDARRCFPCWDEPAIKATFDITLVVPKNLVALSNTNVIFEGEYFEDNKFKVLKYATTPLMSTYVVAIVLGEFDYISGCTSRSVPVKVYTPKGKSTRGKFALDVAIKAIEFYEKYFNIPYPLPKMDLIALMDLSSPAMENWGLVTFIETSLLVDYENSSSKSQRYISLVICHELAHMWFGNLVTMEWWTHLWLNEGFANFMEHVATDDCHPEFDVWTYFVCNDHKKAKDLDALDSSHPIEVPVQNPSEISEIFDSISYSKGATIIRMLHDWLGAENFQRGIQMYLSKHAYSNATTEDLWNSLSDATNMPVREVMGTWTTRMGYPVIKLSIMSKCSEGTRLELIQRKYTDSSKSESADTIWQIPISLVTGNSVNTHVKKFLMTDEKLEITVDNISDHDWIKLNHRYFGFYRAQYDRQLLLPLLDAVKQKELSNHDRLNIQNDLFAMASCGLSSTLDFLSALEYYKDETDYAVWSDLDENIESITVLFWDNSDLFDKFKSYVLTIFENIIQKLGWDYSSGESHSVSMLRSIVIRRMGRYGSTQIIEEARKRFDDHIAGKNTLVANLRDAVYSTVLTQSRDGDLDKLIQLHDSVDLHEERVRIEHCLGCVTDPLRLFKVLDFAMSDKVRVNDKVKMLGSVCASSSIGQKTAWEFIKTNWEKFSSMYSGSIFMARLLIKMTTKRLSTGENLADVQNFFSMHPVQEAERGLRQSIENISKNISWWERDGEAISDWIKKN